MKSDLSRDEVSEYAFYQLVNDDNDLVGMVAYSIYKKEKIRFIQEHKDTNNNNKPDTLKLVDFQKSKCRVHTIEEYRAKASELTMDLVNAILEAKVKPLKAKEEELFELDSNVKTRESSLKTKEEEIKKREKTVKKNERIQKNGYWIGVSQSVVGSFAFIVLTLVILLGTQYSFDIGAMFEKLNTLFQ